MHYQITEVSIIIKDKNLVNSHPIGTIIAEYPISNKKGKLIQNRNHLRDHSKQIEKLKASLLINHILGIKPPVL